MNQKAENRTAELQEIISNASAELNEIIAKTQAEELYFLVGRYFKSERATSPNDTETFLTYYVITGVEDDHVLCFSFFNTQVLTMVQVDEILSVQDLQEEISAREFQSAWRNCLANLGALCFA